MDIKFKTPSLKALAASPFRLAGKAYLFAKEEFVKGATPKQEEQAAKRPSPVVYNHEKGGYERQG